MSSIFGNNTAAASTSAAAAADPSLSLLERLAQGVPAQQTQPQAEGKKQRPKSQYWLNVGMNVAGLGENGEEVFVSMTGGGIALDDLVPAEITGNNPKWIQLQQLKNTILEATQRAAAGREPGGRIVVPLVVEVSRVGKPEQRPDNTNEFASAITGAFAGLGS